MLFLVSLHPYVILNRFVFSYFLNVMRQAFNDVIYDTDTATLIARNALPDTIKYLKGHRNRYLYRTPQGTFFLYLLTESFFGAYSEPDPEIIPLTTEEAVAEYENLADQFVKIEEAFTISTVQ